MDLYCISFNKHITLGFRWELNIITRLSGLSIKKSMIVYKNYLGHVPKLKKDNW